MPEAYPIPHYALSVWQSGNKLIIAIPGVGREAKGHTITLPATESGVAVLLSILRERKREGYERTRQTIGTRGSPTQYDLEKIAEQLLRSSRPGATVAITKLPPTQKRAAPTTLTIEDLDL